MNPEYIEQLIRKYGSVTSEPLLDLITNVVEDAVLEEREACASLCERLPAQQRIDVRDECAAALRARGEKPKRHPGYIVGDHWLQIAYSRICAGDDEAEVMADYGYERGRQ